MILKTHGLDGYPQSLFVRGVLARANDEESGTGMPGHNGRRSVDQSLMALVGQQLADQANGKLAVGQTQIVTCALPFVLCGCETGEVDAVVDSA